MALACLLCCLLELLAHDARAATATEDQTPDGAVRAFNEELSARHLAAALGYLLPGAVTFHLEPAHAFAAPRPGEVAPLTSDLASQWRRTPRLTPA